MKITIVCPLKTKMQLYIIYRYPSLSKINYFSHSLYSYIAPCLSIFPDVARCCPTFSWFLPYPLLHNMHTDPSVLAYIHVSTVAGMAYNIWHAYHYYSIHRYSNTIKVNWVEHIHKHKATRIDQNAADDRRLVPMEIECYTSCRRYQKAGCYASDEHAILRSYIAAYKIRILGWDLRDQTVVIPSPYNTDMPVWYVAAQDVNGNTKITIGLMLSIRTGEPSWNRSSWWKSSHVHGGESSMTVRQIC